MADKTRSEIEKGLALLKSSYDMYESTKAETVSNMKRKLNPDGTKMYNEEDIRKEVELIEEAQSDITAQFLSAGGTMEDLKKKTRKRKAAAVSGDLTAMDDPEIPLVESPAVPKKPDVVEPVKVVGRAAQPNEFEEIAKLDQEYIPKKGDYDPQAAFDVIPLPSKGEGYADKISKLSVAYLTAYDENMIVAPNLYRDNLIVDYLLQEKILSKEIDPMDLLEGDREAVILFLRASGYGNEYPITAVDDITGKEFDSMVDLSELKYKEFNLKGDSNGWFPFTLPVSGREVKFRFPTHRDIVTLERLQAAEESSAKKDAIESYVKSLDTFVEADKDINEETRISLRKAVRTIEAWGESIDAEDITKFSHSLTNRLMLLVKSVDGITDVKYIRDFILSMNVRDSVALRRYITENEPGIDYTITVNRPESLGGGSFKTFLQLDKFLFLNLPD